MAAQGLPHQNPPLTLDPSGQLLFSFSLSPCGMLETEQAIFPH